MTGVNLNNVVKKYGETQVIPDMVTLATFFDPDGHTLMFAEDELEVGNRSLARRPTRELSTPDDDEQS